MLKLRHATLCVCLLLCVVGLSSEARTSAHKPCYPPHSDTLARNGEGRVYLFRKSLYACRFRNGRIFDLALNPPNEYPYPIAAINGTVVAYARDECDQGCGTALEARSLLGPKDPVYPSVRSEPRGDDGAVKIGSIAVTRNGRIAWIECPRADLTNFPYGSPRPNCTRPGLSENTVYFSAGPAKPKQYNPPRVLDQGTGVDPASLRLEGSTLRWKTGDEVRTAQL